VPRERIPEAKLFRSTWLSSSILSLREHGDYERYLTLLEPRFRQEIESLVAGRWLPIEIAIAHYEACGRLGLTKSEIAERGLQVTRQVHQTVLATLLRLAREAGASPWTVYAQLDRLWDRVFHGGGVCVTKRGPKEAVIEIVQWPCANVPYCRAAMPAVVTAVTEMFCRKAYVQDMTRSERNAMSLKCAWA
jgi:hypothetical protein